MNYHLITPCSRPYHLDAVYGSILAQRMPTDNITWWIIFDADRVLFDVQARFNKLRVETGSVRGKPWGDKQTDVALERIKDGWVYRVDDDNIIHRDFLARLSNVSGCALVVDQVWKNGDLRLRASPENLKPLIVDTAQFAVKREAIGSVRWIDYVKHHNTMRGGDGYFIQQIHNRHMDDFTFVNEPLCYYNYLKEQT
jgi:hypothetical protein